LNLEYYRIGLIERSLLLQKRIGEVKKGGSKKLAWNNSVVAGKLVEEGKLVGRENEGFGDREEVRQRVERGGKKEGRRERIRKLLNREECRLLIQDSFHREERMQGWAYHRKKKIVVVAVVAVVEG